MKHDAIVEQGIPIHERVPIPDEMIPEDSRVEIDAKIQAGYCKSFPSPYRYVVPAGSALAVDPEPPNYTSPWLELTPKSLVTTGNVMTMEELANVKGRGWEDIDVRVPLHSSYLSARKKADSNHSTERLLYWGSNGGSKKMGHLRSAFEDVGCNWPSYKHDLRRCRVFSAR
jgi:hypothetical protein